LPFLPPFPYLLCYDGTHGHTGPVRGREKTGWTLWRWGGIRWLPWYARGGGWAIARASGPFSAMTRLCRTPACTPRRQHRARDKQGSIPVWLGEPTLPLSTPTTREAARPQTPPSSVAPSRPDVARRQLTMLCCDLVGSTALAT